MVQESRAFQEVLAVVRGRASRGLDEFTQARVDELCQGIGVRQVPAFQDLYFAELQIGGAALPEFARFLVLRDDVTLLTTFDGLGTVESVALSRWNAVVATAGSALRDVTPSDLQDYVCFVTRLLPDFGAQPFPCSVLQVDPATVGVEGALLPSGIRLVIGPDLTIVDVRRP